MNLFQLKRAYLQGLADLTNKMTKEGLPAFVMQYCVKDLAEQLGQLAIQQEREALEEEREAEDGSSEESTDGEG